MILMGMLVLLGVWLITACDLFKKNDSLFETTWMLETLNGNPLIQDSAITIAFEKGITDEYDYFSGYAGCNYYSGPVDLTNEKIVFINLPNMGMIVTEILCYRTGIVEQEVAYLETLRSVTTYRVSGEQVTMNNAAGEAVLVFQLDE